MKKFIKLGSMLCLGFILSQGKNANAQVVSDTFFFSNSIVTFKVPNGVTQITVTAIGATGGKTVGDSLYGGHGANLTGTFSVIPDSTLKILVGGEGGNGNGGGGGGGGTFVTDIQNNPLIIAGGGGGVACTLSEDTMQILRIDATLADSGLTGNSRDGNLPNNYGIGGRNGNGATNASGGGPCGGNAGGLLTDGQSNGCCTVNTHGFAFVNGGAGGVDNGCFQGGPGGFGCAGSGSDYGGGGGGGYSGGGGSWHHPTNAGGGGSFNGGTSQTNFIRPDTGNGLVVISYTAPLGISAVNRTAKISIYPNPTDGHFTIYGIAKGDVVKVYNYLGEEVSNRVANNSDNMKYDISGEASGVYLVKIQNTNGKLITEKRIIKAQ